MERREIAPSLCIENGMTKKLCRECGYDLAGASASKCPECGVVVVRDGMNTFVRYKWRCRRTGVAIGTWIGVVVVVVANAVTLLTWPRGTAPDIFNFGWPFPVWYGANRVAWGIANGWNAILSCAACCLIVVACRSCAMGVWSSRFMISRECGPGRSAHVRS